MMTGQCNNYNSCLVNVIMAFDIGKETNTSNVAFPTEKARPFSEFCTPSLKRVSVCGSREVSVIDLRWRNIRGRVTEFGAIP